MRAGPLATMAYHIEQGADIEALLLGFIKRKGAFLAATPTTEGFGPGPHVRLFKPPHGGIKPVGVKLMQLLVPSLSG